MICTIHQPNFMPWLPFFQKMKQADVFVLLTDCQWEKGGFQNRFRLSDGRWHTMSVRRGLEPIRDKQYAQPVKDWERILSALPGYEDTLQDLTPCIGPSLVDTNEGIIRLLAMMLGVTTSIAKQPAGEACGTARLVDICRTLKCDTYLSGSDGRRYMDESLFTAAGIRVIYQDPAAMDRRHALEALQQHGRGYMWESRASH